MTNFNYRVILDSYTKDVERVVSIVLKFSLQY